MGLASSGPMAAAFAVASPSLGHLGQSSAAKLPAAGASAAPSGLKRQGAGQAPAALLAAACAATGLVAGRRQRLAGRAKRSARRAGFGPNPYEENQRKNVTLSGDVGDRISATIKAEARGIKDQLRQYGFCQVDGFLGGSITGYADTIRNEMKSLFDRGWFQEETEEMAAFKVGMIKLGNQDRDHRFVSKLLATQPGDADGEKRVATQFEVAPTVVNFTRSLIGSLSKPLAKLIGGRLSTNIANAEMAVLCGNGARYDRRVSNEYGWNTKQGFAPDSRKLSAFYFVNPEYREEHGGHLQLEGVITPTGMVSITPIHDRLVLFWSDKTVWSVRPSQAFMISEHQYSIMTHMMATEHKHIDYRPTEIARWFPELSNIDMPWPPPYLDSKGDL